VTDTTHRTGSAARRGEPDPAPLGRWGDAFTADEPNRCWRDITHGGFRPSPNRCPHPVTWAGYYDTRDRNPDTAPPTSTHRRRRHHHHRQPAHGGGAQKVSRPSRGPRRSDSSRCLVLHLPRDWPWHAASEQLFTRAVYGPPGAR